MTFVYDPATDSVHDSEMAVTMTIVSKGFDTYDWDWKYKWETARVAFVSPDYSGTLAVRMLWHDVSTYEMDLAQPSGPDPRFNIMDDRDERISPSILRANGEDAASTDKSPFQTYLNSHAAAFQEGFVELFSRGGTRPYRVVSEYFRT